MASMTDTSQFHNGLKIILDGNPFTMVYFQHVKPGKGGAFVRTKVKNLLNGRTIERTFRSGEKVELADIQEKSMQYLYQEGENLVFMDQQTYDQIPIPPDVIGDAIQFMLENMEVDVLFWNGKPVNIPSYLVKTGDVISVREKSKKQNRVVEALQLAQQVGIPAWVEVNADKAEGTFKKVPDRDEFAADIKEALIVELYSR